MRSKKAFIQDFAFFGVVILIFVIAIFVGSLVLRGFNEKYQGLEIPNSVAGQEILQENTDKFTKVFDGIFMTVFILMAIAIFASMFLIDSNPALFFIIVIVFAFLLIALAIFQNVYENMVQQKEMAIEASFFPMLDFIMTNWVTFMLIFGFVAITLFFAKVRTGVFR